MLIYKITNNLNGMKYVGQTIRKLSERLKAHKSLKNNKCPYLKNAIAKYGFDNFSVEILAETDDKKELDALEIKFIASENSMYPNGYNLRPGGQQGGPMSEESKAKLSNSNKGRKLSEEAKKKLSEAFSGSKHPQYGKEVPLERRERISQSLKGKKKPPRSEETRKKISTNAKAKGIEWIQSAINASKKSIICHQNGKIYSSFVEASKDLNISRISIRHVIQGKIKFSKGLSFSLVEKI